MYSHVSIALDMGANVLAAGFRQDKLRCLRRVITLEVNQVVNSDLTYS